MQHQYFLRFAYKQLNKSTCFHYKIAAIIVNNHQIYAIGTNQAKTHPLQKNQFHQDRCGSSIHAELDCLIKCRYDKINGATIYVCRKLKNGNFALAKPCYLCEFLLKQYGIKKVIYSIGPTENDYGELMYENN
jgi:dCMP deaminase